jgi:hypothetical protein
MAAIAGNVLGVVAVSPFLIREVPRGGGSAVLGLLFVATVALNTFVLLRQGSRSRAMAAVRRVALAQDAAWTLGMVIGLGSALTGAVPATTAGFVLISTFAVVIIVSAVAIVADLRIRAPAASGT